MSRYGWSLHREASSPYSSMQGGPPAVTDDDFSYITSQDLDTRGVSSSRNRPAPDDDVLLIKSKGVTYPAHFPPYSIDDGKLLVRDIKNRLSLIIGLSDRRTQRIKLLYKGRQLKDSEAPVREYGVKNNSELMAVIPDHDYDADTTFDRDEVEPREESSKSKKSKKTKRGKKKRTDRSDAESAGSPFDSNLSSISSPRSPPPPQQQQQQQPPAAQSSMQKLNAISDEYRDKWVPLCQNYIASPPSDSKKRDDEHRKISESIMQQIILKLDGVETEGNPEIRTRRKALVTEVQDMFKRLDIAKAG